METPNNSSFPAEHFTQRDRANRPCHKAGFSNTNPQSRYPQPTGQSESGTNEVFNSWMAEFCVEPSGDSETCVLAYVVPCAQYGKTDWRLNQIAEGKDPSNASWKPNYGCNGPCWAHCGLTYFCGLGWIFVGLQRSRIRANYGIRGNVATDFIQAICCQSCTLMQHDREVRAREGQMDLRNNKTYQKGCCTSTQPAPVQPMRYVSPQQTSDYMEQNFQGGRSGIEPLRAAPADEMLQKPKDKSDRIREAVVSEPPSPQHNSPAVEMHHIRASQSSPPDSNTLVALQANESLVNDSKELIDEKEPASKQPDPVVNASRTEIDKTGLRSIIGSSPTPGFAKYGGEVTVFNEGVEYRSQQHTLVDCSTSSKAAGQDAVNVIYAHELSYVHDFSDCPVDESVLEYYETEGKRSHQHALADCAWTGPTNIVQSNSNEQHSLAGCTRASSRSKVEPDDAEQHASANCPGDGGASFTSTTVSTSQHRRASSPSDCPMDKSSRTKQHRLASCPVPISPNSKKASINRPVDQNVRTNQSGDSQLTLMPSSQHALGDSSDDTNGKGKGRTVEEHRHDEIGVTQCMHHACTQDSENAKWPAQRRSSNHRKEIDNTSNFGEMKSNRPAERSAQDALSQVLGSAAGRKENSHKGPQVDGNPDVGKQSEKVGLQEEQKISGSGIGSIFNKMTILKNKGQP